MKNLLFLAMIFSMTLAACGGDKDENTPTDAELILGTWDLVSVLATNCVNPEDNAALTFGSESCISFFGASICFEGNMEFNADGTATQEIVSTTTAPDGGVTTETDSSTGTYEFTGDNLTLCFDGECIEGTYTLSASSMTWMGTDSDGCENTFRLSK